MLYSGNATLEVYDGFGGFLSHQHVGNVHFSSETDELSLCLFGGFN